MIQNCHISLQISTRHHDIQALSWGNESLLANDITYLIAFLEKLRFTPYKSGSGFPDSHSW